MGEYFIKGGNVLSGEVKINGAKNAILPILAAVILNADESIIHNCPLISDTFVSIEILESIGCKINLEGNTLIIDSKCANNFNVPEHLVRELRSSFIFLGGVLGRFGQVKISYPGGCELGARPIDLHLKGLRDLGVKITEEHGFIICVSEKLIGTRINLDFPSVGATENIMLASIFAEGTTTISNAAKEPEIVDLQNFLVAMGADISGAGSDTIIINGVEKLHKVEYSVMPDRIVAGTFLVASAMTKGKILLTGIDSENIYPIVTKMKEVGCTFVTKKNQIYMEAPQIIKPIERLRTHPHPGFPTDMQPQFMAMLSIAKGTSIVAETVFESRNKHISELNRMGANIILSQDGMTSVVKGVSGLNGTIVTSKDLRGGAALILAGLAAEGETIVLNSNYVERGYEKIEETLKTLGGNIRILN